MGTRFNVNKFYRFRYRDRNYLKALVADGVFVESGTFRVLPPIPTVLLAEPLRHAVLDYLVEDEAITRRLPTGSFPGSTQDFLLITQSVLVRTIRKAAASWPAI